MAFDWTKGEGDEGERFDPTTFRIAAATPARSSEDVERDRTGFLPITEYNKEYLFQVHSFTGKPAEQVRTCYYNGREVAYHPYSFGVRLVTADSRVVTDFFDLPPSDPDEWPYYFGGSKDQNGDNPGFMAEKFQFFLSKLGWPIPKGGAIPDEALIPANWLGRWVYAFIIAPRDDDRIDPTTGKKAEKKAYPQVKLFSYRASDRPRGGSIKPSSQPDAAARPDPAKPPGAASAAPAKRPTAVTNDLKKKSVLNL